MTWWMPRSPDRDCEAIVCDGAVRSGKTLSMGLGFFLWAMCRFDGRQFGLCGKTMGSLRRNVLQELTPWLEMLGMQVTERYDDISLQDLVEEAHAELYRRQEEKIRKETEEEA